MEDGNWSASEADVLSDARGLLEADRPGVLATVIDVRGSAYRRPGAKMVVAEDGGGAGNITAGCLEDEVADLARDVLDAGRLRVKTYDLMDDDVWGLGIGCNGVVDVLLEPLDESHLPILDSLEAGEAVASVTVVESGTESVSVGDKLYVTHTEEDETDTSVSARSNSALAERLPDSVLDSVHELLTDGKAGTTSFETDGETVRVFVDAIVPPPKLVVLGTGNDVEPVVELARQTGFDVTVVSFRGGKDVASLFPAAHEGLTTSPASIRDSHPFDENTYVVVMTHNFVDDRLALDELLQTDAAYIGLLGPQKRFAEMLDEFDDEGRSFSEAELDRIYTPIGLNLGGGTPYQIAQSIVSEVIAVHNGTEPGHLRDREGPIHERVVLPSDD